MLWVPYSTAMKNGEIESATAVICFANLKSFEYFCGNDFQPEDSGDMPGTG